MARVKNGALASVSWDNNTGLVTSGAASSDFQYVETGNPQDATVLGATTEQMHGTLRAATGTITTRIDAVEIGNAAGVAVASSGYYAEHIRQWRLDMAAVVHPTTDMNTGANPTWLSFEPGLVRIAGVYEGVPSTTVNQTGASGVGDTTRAVSLTLRGSNVFSGDAVVERMALQVNPRDAGVTMSFASAGDWTKTGTTFLAAGTIGSESSQVGFSTGELTLTYTTGQTIVGDAFPEAISITAPVSGIITVQTQVRFTGAVVHS